ncbi:hypothetical protein [Pseudoxanthomonas winnipegensis]|uniref:hypothetical protein n=1 Tax=Pseudoxanthomonas winnipegensis TaxID=2480810 RepID=UPI00102D6907|nr:hypothetical protein [Pseudoxanthomonas winnipegensis]TAA08848.1 hypothetical protein EA659_13435 [Pseudoxanthomonas winnipegensis]TAH71798.1 hypothetical protein EA657_11790 [Pseudoxanthomonas winnipegensis]
MKVLTCTSYDTATATCTEQVWADEPVIIPPMSAEDGLLLSGLMWGPVILAWGFSLLRRYIAPKWG